MQGLRASGVRHNLKIEEKSYFGLSPAEIRDVHLALRKALDFRPHMFERYLQASAHVAIGQEGRRGEQEGRAITDFAQGLCFTAKTRNAGLDIGSGPLT